MSNQIQVSVEITSSLGRRLNISVPTERFEQKVKERIQQLAKTSKIDGFRPGKIPAKTAETLFGQVARAEAADKLLQISLSEAVIQEKLQPAGQPIIESFKAEVGTPFQYTASFEVFPDVELKNLSGVTLEKTIVNIADTDIDHVLEQMRKQHANWQESNLPAEQGNRVTFDMVVDEDKKEQKGLQLLLEEGAMPAEFAILKGTKVGDELSIEWQNMHAIVKVQKIEVPELPAIDDAFAKRFGISDSTVAGLQAEVRKHLQTELEKTLQNKLKTQLIDKLLELHPLELPKTAVQAEYDYLAEEFRRRIKQQMGQEIKDIPESVATETQVTAQRRVTLGLIFPAAIKHFDVKLDEARLRSHLERMLAAFENSPGMLEKVSQDKNLMAGIRSQVLEEQVVEKLLEQVQFTEQTLAYADFMKLAAHDNHMMHDDYYEHNDHVHDENCEHGHIHDENCQHDH